jgi:hypothetical protein
LSVSLSCAEQHKYLGDLISRSGRTRGNGFHDDNDVAGIVDKQDGNVGVGLQWRRAIILILAVAIRYQIMPALHCRA